MATQDKNLLVLNAGQIEKAAAEDTIRVHSLAVDAGVAITGDTSIDGDLSVTGTIVSKNVESLVVRDPFIDLGLGNTSATAQAGGFSVAMNRLSSFTAETVTDFVAGVGAPTNTPPTFTVSGGSSALVAGDIVAITGASDVNNDGLYVVASVAAGVVTIKGVGGSSPSGSVPFVQNQFTAASAQTATAYKVEMVVAAFADGTSSFKDSGGVAWAKGLFVTTAQPWSTEAQFNANGAYDTAAQTSLQEAYVVGNTITTSAGEGDVVIAGDQKLDVSATGGVAIATTLDLNGSMDADVTTYDVNASGAYTVVAGAASSIATSAGDLTLDAQNASLILDGGEAAADAVRIAASAAGGGIDIDAGTGGIAADSTGAISLGAAAASDFTVAGDLTLETTGAGITDVKSAAEVQITTLLFDVNASGAVEINAFDPSNFTVAGADLTLATVDTGNIVVDSAGGLDIDSWFTTTIDVASGGISIDVVDASNFTVASTGDAQDLTLAVTGATNSSVLVASSGTGADAIGLTASAGGITVDAAGALSLDSTGTTSNLTLSANDAGTATLTIAASNTGAGVADLDVDADGAVTIDGASFSVDATSASNMTVTGGNLTLSTATSGVLAVTAAGNLDMDAVGTVTIDSSGAAISIGSNADAYGINIGTGAAARTITVGNTTGATALDVNLGTGGMTVDTQSGGAISLDAVGAASNFTVDGGNLTLSTLTSGNLVLASAGNIDADGAIVTVDATANISLDAATNSNFTVTGSGQNLTIGVLGGGAQQLILGSAGTGANSVRINSAGGIDVDAAAAISLVSAGTASEYTLNANDAGASALTIEAKNAGAGSGTLSLKAKTTIDIGDSATYAGALVSINHFAAFKSAGGYIAEAGEVLAVGDAVVAKWDAGASKVRYFKAANNAVSDVLRNVHGIVGSAAGAAGNTFRLQSVAGLMVSTALSGLTNADIAKPVFLGTGGALTLTPPNSAGSSVFRVGFVVSHDGGPASTAVVQYQPQFIAKIL